VGLAVEENMEPRSNPPRLPRVDWKEEGPVVCLGENTTGEGPVSWGGACDDGGVTCDGGGGAGL
jgi:hypothetical protein